MTRVTPLVFPVKARDLAFVRLRNAVVQTRQGRRRRSGLGDAASCEAIGLLYDARYGSCTNVPPPAAVDPSNFVQTPFTSPVGLPPSLAMNPVTGVIEKQTPLQQLANASRFGPQVTPDEATQRALAAEAERIGAERGVSVKCTVYGMGDPVHNRGGFSTDCTVNGDPGHNAALLLRSGGMETAVISAAYGTGNPLYQIPVLKNEAAVTQALDAGGRPLQPWMAYIQPASTEQTAPALLPDPIPVTASNGATPPAKTQTGGPSATTPAGGAISSQAITRQISDLADQAKTIATGWGLPSWAPLAAAAAIGGYFLLGGKRR